MPETDRTALQIALRRACEFALAHDVETSITPEDFGIQRSGAGTTHATYVDSGHVVSVIIDRYGETEIAVAELDWIHDEGDGDREPCDYCEVIDPDAFDADECFFGRPVIDVYLPGDAPAPVTADV